VCHISHRTLSVSPHYLVKYKISTRAILLTYLKVKVKVTWIYIARSREGAQAWITQFYLHITPCLSLPRKRSPDGASKSFTKWLLRLNIEKCKVMHIGNHFNSSYCLHGGCNTSERASTHTERDLRVCVTNDLKWAELCGKAAAKASSILGLIRRHFRHTDCQSFQILYKTYVRPHLD